MNAVGCKSKHVDSYPDHSAAAHGKAQPPAPARLVRTLATATARAPSAYARHQPSLGIGNNEHNSHLLATGKAEIVKEYERDWEDGERMRQREAVGA